MHKSETPRAKEIWTSRSSIFASGVAPDSHTPRIPALAPLEKKRMRSVQPPEALVRDPTADCNDIDSCARHRHTPRCDYALICGSER
jgi:hypothetical protein